jgi:hypothetical protein
VTKAPLALLFLAGCAIFSPVTIARELGTVGWFQAGPDSRWHRVDDKASCEAVASKVGEGQVIVFVHGVKGDGDEISGLLPTLAKAKPAAVFLYRWVPWDERDSIARGFAAGISHLLDCVPGIDGNLLVLAHSAGGMVVGYGAPRLVVPPRARKGPALYVMTVASPLAGMDDRTPNPGGQAQAKFMLDFGTRVVEYPVGPAAMAVVHLRTQYPGDQVMKPTATHAPNDPTVGIPGAKQIDLPAQLNHDSALAWVAAKIVDGSWQAWFARDDEGSAPSRDLLKEGDQLELGPGVGRLEVDEHRAHQRDLFRR